MNLLQSLELAVLVRCSIETHIQMLYKPKAVTLSSYTYTDKMYMHTYTHKPSTLLLFSYCCHTFSHIFTFDNTDLQYELYHVIEKIQQSQYNHHHYISALMFCTFFTQRQRQEKYLFSKKMLQDPGLLPVKLILNKNPLLLKNNPLQA